MPTKLPFLSLLQDMLDYNPTEFISAKAARVYMMCIRTDRLELAQKIQSKYSISKETSDIVMAFQYALMAHNQKSI